MASVLLRNGELADPSMTKDRLLKEHTGAYSTARTVCRSAVFEFSMHCERLHTTALAVLEREISEKSGDDVLTRERAVGFLKRAGAASLKPLVCRDLLEALRRLGVASGEVPSEAATSTGEVDFQVTILLTCEGTDAHTPTDRGFDMFTLVNKLPVIEAMVGVEAHRAERSNPTIKDVQWVKDRQQLEELQRSAGVNEIIMFDDQGHVTEGLQSNFFAVAGDGAVLTAPDERVLAGTVRKVVLEVAQREGIPLRAECPSIHDAASWDSCFVCSTSRLVKPVRELAAPELTFQRQFPAEGSVAHRIEALVLDAVQKNSEPITA